MKNKVLIIIYLLIMAVLVSCGGGGGGGGGLVAFAPDNNMPHNDGGGGDWGEDPNPAPGIGGPSIEDDNATLLLGQSAALSYQKVDIDLVVNNEHFSILNVTATTTTKVLPKISIGASVSGTATIYLNDGSVRVARLEMTEIGIHNNLLFKVPYNYKCIDATTGAETTSGTYFSREGIDLAAYTIAPIEGWKCLEDDSIHAGSYVTGVRGDITLEPVYGTSSSYIASFVTLVQSADAPALSFTSADIVQLPVLSSQNLAFEGWYEDSAFTGQPVSLIPAGTAENKTYYAKWTATVTYKRNDGTDAAHETQTVNYGATTAPLSAPTRQYYDFANKWYTDSGCTQEYDFSIQVTQDMTLYAKWNPIEHNIIYDMSGVTGAAFTPSDNDKKFYEHQAKTLPTSGPTCSGLTFDSWHTNPNLSDSSRITSIPTGTTQDVTLYPKWTATVTYKLNDGTDATHETQTVDRGVTTAPLSAPTRQYYDFANKWYTDSGCTQEYNFSTPVTQNLKLYAKWNRRQHNVTYNMSGVTGYTFTPVSTFYEHEGISQTSLPSPSKTGLTFAGWHKRSDCTDSRVTSIAVGTDDNVTLYAEWTAKVTFNSNGGSGVSPSYRDVPYNTTVTAPTTSWTDHRCLGWYLESACTTEFDFTQRITQNKTLYAKWITSFSGSGEKSVHHEDGKTDYDVELNGFNRTADTYSASFSLNNRHPGTTMNVTLSIIGTNRSIGGNHGGLKLTSGSSSQGGTINVVFSTTSTTGATLELGFQNSGSGDIQVENVTATFAVAPGCTISDMKVGDTTYTDFNDFINAAKNDKNPSRKASFTIKKN